MRLNLGAKTIPLHRKVINRLCIGVYLHDLSSLPTLQPVSTTDIDALHVRCSLASSSQHGRSQGLIVKKQTSL
jgi:hypothetical protein